MKTETENAANLSRLNKWAIALAGAFFSRARHHDHRRCLSAADVLARITRLVAHENKFRPNAAGRTRPWSPRLDVSCALAAAFPEEAPISKLLRRHIYHLAEGGVLSAAEAEHWAEMFQWRPFAAEPDEALFDPLEMKLWPLGMAIRWVERVAAEQHPDAATLASAREWLNMTLQRVRREWPDFVEQSLCWQKNQEGGVSLVNRVFEAADYVDPLAKQLVLNALRSGVIQAVGWTGSMEQKISPERWAALRIVGQRDRDGCDAVIEAAASGIGVREVRPQYDAVYINRHDLMSAFPAPAPSPPISKRRVSPAELERLLIEESSRRGGAPIGQRAAQEIVESLGITAPRQVLRKVVSKLWPTPPGRPRKNADQ